MSDAEFLIGIKEARCDSLNVKTDRYIDKIKEESTNTLDIQIEEE